jgi:hypothetical protein
MWTVPDGKAGNVVGEDEISEEKWIWQRSIEFIPAFSITWKRM